MGLLWAELREDGTRLDQLGMVLSFDETISYRTKSVDCLWKQVKSIRDTNVFAAPDEICR